jgi:serine/threonine protein kinase
MMINDGDTTQRTTLAALGRYHIVRRIGKGGMGDVWLAEDPRLHRQVAIKTLPIHGRGDREFSLRFEREAQAAAALNHPHILPIHDYGEEVLPAGGVISYIVMPFITGGSLADRLVQSAGKESRHYTSRVAGMPAGEALAYLSQAADAIDYAHVQGIIHRDIKPANMLLRSDDWLLLADFGIARVLSGTESLTQTGKGFGTPEYMAPEQAQGQAEAASDNYSLAVIAYQFFTGRLPFSADTGYAITIQHMTMPPPPPRQFNPTIAPSFEQVLLRGLAKRPAERPSSARAFVAELQGAMADAPYEATFFPAAESLTRTSGGATTHGSTDAPGVIGSGKLRQQPSTLSRRSLIIAGGAGLAVIGGGLGAWAIVNNAHSGPGPSPARRPTPRPQPSPARDPNAPAIVLQGQHINPANALAWSPRANVFATVANSDNLFLWDLQQLLRLQPSTSSPAPTPTPSPKAQQSISNGSSMQLAWSPDGSRLAVANTGNSSAFSNRQSIDVYAGDLSKRLATFTADSADSIQGLGWAREGMIVAASDEFNLNIKDSHIQIWAALSTQTRQSLTARLLPGSLSSPNPNDTAPLLAVAPDGSTIALGLSNGVAVGKVSLTGAAPSWRQLTATLPFDQLLGDPAAVTWSPDGRNIGSFYTLGSSQLCFWHWPGAAKKPALVISSDATLTMMAWCPAASSSLLATGTQDGNILIWNQAKKKDQHVGSLNSGGVNAEVLALAWSADGNWLAASYKDNNSSILLWKIQGRGF